MKAVFSLLPISVIASALTACGGGPGSDPYLETTYSTSGTYCSADFVMNYNHLTQELNFLNETLKKMVESGVNQNDPAVVLTMFNRIASVKETCQLQFAQNSTSYSCKAQRGGSATWISFKDLEGACQDLY